MAGRERPEIAMMRRSKHAASSRPARLRIRPRHGVWMALGGMWLASGCATVPPVAVTPARPAAARSTAARPPALMTVRGSTYTVQRGDTVWGIAQAFGIPSQTLVSANRLRSSTELRLGQRLFIPPPTETSRFLWPARGQLSRLPSSTWTASRPGLEIRAPEGGYVRATRSGRVAVAARHVTELGNTIVLDHGDGYLSIYCGLDEMFVAPGSDIRQGNPIGRLGRTPLYFEIRYRTVPRDPLAMLP